MDIEQWATQSAVSDPLYWESCFPGHGKEIARFTALFQGWKPVFGQADATLESDILEGTHCLGVVEVSVNPLSNADDAQSMVGATASEEFWKILEKKHRLQEICDLLHDVNDSVGDAFGPVIGRRIPPVMLRSWLYDIIVCAIVCEVLGEKELVASLEKIMQRWKTGQYLIGLDIRETPPKAVVIVSDPS